MTPTLPIRRGLAATMSDDGSSLTIEGPAIAATVTFRPDGRVDGVSATLGPTPA